MKAVIFISSLIVIVALGIGSFYFFVKADYYTSAFLTMGTYLSLSFWVNKLNEWKLVPGEMEIKRH